MSCKDDIRPFWLIKTPLSWAAAAPDERGRLPYEPHREVLPDTLTTQSCLRQGNLCDLVWYSLVYYKQM